MLKVVVFHVSLTKYADYIYCCIYSFLMLGHHSCCVLLYFFDLNPKYMN